MLAKEVSLHCALDSNFVQSKCFFVFFYFWCCLSFITGPIVKGSAPTTPERERSTGLESPKKRASKLLPSFKIPAFKKTKGSE